MPQQFISNNGQKLVNNALQSTGLDKVGVTTAVDKAGKQLNKQFKKTFGSEDTKNKISLEEQAEKDAKKKRADQAAYNKMSDEEKRAHDNQKSVDQRIKSEQDSETQKQLYNNSDWGKQQNAKKQREGSRHEGFGNSRPENIGSIASKIALGRNRSISAQMEQESHKGSRKGGNMTGAEWILNNKYIYENGEIKLGLIQLKDIQDATDKFKQQIISEGKEDYYIIALAAFGGTFSMQLLPIYGDPNKYVTRWFCPTPQGAIDSAKRDTRSVPAKLLKGQVDENGNVTSRQGSRKGGMLDAILEDRDNVAQSMYGKPYSELSEEEKNSATNKQIGLKKQQG